MTSRAKRIAFSTFLAGSLAAGLWFGFGNNDATAGGETRTLSLYQTHTKESLTVTYKVNGRYIPSAMEKLNYILRDWRRNEVIRIDPKTIDLVWELHADLGSTRPVHIVSGFRSPKTNAFLKRIGRNVAKKSQHMVGKAIDIYFPDVPTQRVRTAPWSARSAASAIIRPPASTASSMSIQARSACGRACRRASWPRFSATIARPSVPAATPRTRSW